MKPEEQKTDLKRWLSLVLLVLILAGGAYLRFVGLDWDEEQHLHPDERFLTMVESSLLPVSSLGEYFNTGISTLNPNNQGHGFYVYGTLPVFMVRYLAEWTGDTGYGNVYLVGRSLSAVMDLLSVAVVFFIGSRLFNRRVGLLSAAFSALAVLQIQQSHFFTVDTFTTFFTMLAVYFAVEVATAPRNQLDWISYLLFGVSLGMAVASKINAAPVALVLPLASLVHWLNMDPEQKDYQFPRILLHLLLAAAASLVIFRICQPYAFRGPGFFNLGLNENWISSLRSLHAQTSGDVDFPPALQWARRPVWFSLQNMLIWGLGLPYGILAWAGYLRLGWKAVRPIRWKPELVILVWTGAYFVWQSLQWNSTMRYQLPIYPLMGIFAAWLLIDLWETAGRSPDHSRLLQRGITALGLVVLLSTAVWAAAFSGIYTRPHPRVAATRWIFENLPGPATLKISSSPDTEPDSQQLLAFPADRIVQNDVPWSAAFEARSDGYLTAVALERVLNLNPSVTPLTLEASLLDQNGTVLALARQEVEFTAGVGSEMITFSPAPELVLGQMYQLTMSVLDPAGAFSLQGAGIANESSWDDGIPLRMDGYDPFGGIYQSGLNFEMYWDDNPEKLERFLNTLEQADYIMITSSRQWASTTRVPERYPLTTEYYRQLVGCPDTLSVEACYNRAEPGMYLGGLGFDLVQTFHSNPALGPFQINDQPAEEAFTVYDHPKVFIFQKGADYSTADVEDILSRVDLSTVVRLTPRQADSHPGNLLLPQQRLAAQREGGTWSDLFDYSSILNRNQLAGAAAWYLAVFLLGLIVYPLLRPLVSGLSDRGYPLARTLGLLLLSYLVWLAGSAGIPVLRSMILGILLLLSAAGLYAGFRQRDSLLQEWRSSRRYYIVIEILALALFCAALLIRYGNPDLWHPWKGGERPMDFSYLNAVLKSTTYPPYDPWFAGGYINYYYYGFILVGTLTKLLGIVPSIAYNLIMATIFMLLGLGVFSLVWNLLDGRPDRDQAGDPAYLGAGAGVLGLLIFGNLGQLRMIVQGVQRLASGGVNVLDGSFFERLKWTLLGLVELVRVPALYYRLDEWYWNPSRVIGAEHGGPITEFPFFSFLYGDPHAHFIALPLTVLALGWMISVIKRPLDADSKRGQGWLLLLGSSLLGGLCVGALRPTNTWDFYPYLALGGACLVYVWWRDSRRPGTSWVKSAVRLGLFLLLAYLTFQPYASWYGEGYTSIKPWFGSRTPVNDYLTHWGLFLLVLFSWMVYESIDWMASTPVSALRKLSKYKELLIAGALVLVVILVSFGIELENDLSLKGFTILGGGVHIIWITLPMMVWALILLFRPGQTEMKTVVLFLIGTGLAVTLMVELIYVEGDIGRMNTVFKFYLQAWTLLSVSAAAALAWLIPPLRNWTSPSRVIWQVLFTLLLASAALYPVLGGVSKIKDRMAPDAPASLDGMSFMQVAVYNDLGTELELNQDYQAIRWMQDNISGSPVIVEANQVEYHWGTRYTVYTGLPGVVGWNWHQRQQRTLTPHEWVYSRVDQVNQFYETADLDQAADFLERYQVSYIVVGQLEQAKYSPEGIEKFQLGEGRYWLPVYQSQDTTIYQVLTGSR